MTNKLTDNEKRLLTAIRDALIENCGINTTFELYKRHGAVDEKWVTLVGSETHARFCVPLESNWFSGLITDERYDLEELLKGE